MRFLRNRIVARFFSAFGILIFLNSIFYPTMSYALTTGPHQPEYTSYEEPGAKDMVNLLTGDFTFNMPILTVPVGSEGGFTVPMSYHAGIGPEMESSWVGLGWNINVGSITRTINGYPDDASGKETQTITVQDLTGRRGWNANFLGSSIGWDSQVGHYGVINLVDKISYDEKGISSVGFVGGGLTVGRSGSLSFDGGAFIMTVAQVASAVASYGATEAVYIGLQLGMQQTMQLIMDAATKDYTPSAPTAGLWEFTKDTDRGLFHTNYWIWLDQTRVEDMYGTLYVDKAPTINHTANSDFATTKLFINNTEQTLKQFKFATGTINKGAASDINIDLSNASASSYENNVTPAVLSYDNFRVNGPGISGRIKPYRLEIGSVSTPREMTPRHVRLSALPFMDYGTNKVPFVYEGSNGNRYFHHVGGSSSVTSPVFNFGLSASGNGNSQPGMGVIQYDLNDFIFSNERIRADISTTKRIPQGHYIDWLTNAEIKNTAAGFLNTAYLDYFSGTTRTAFRTTFEFGGRTAYYSQSSHLNDGMVDLPGQGSQFEVDDIIEVNLMIYNPPNLNQIVDSDIYSGRVLQVNTNSIKISLPSGANYLGKIVSIEIVSRKSNKADNSIGGFVITSADGTNYHYSIPVYDYDFKTETIDKNDDNKRSIITRSAPFANTWLLTAITGSDFVDRGGSGNSANGVIDNNDWGYWVKFNYGKHTSNNMWRIPFSGYKLDAADQHKIYAHGFKEKYYLNTIETRSHVALFIKNSRADGLDVNAQQSLRLSEIALITKDAYNQLTDPSGPYQLSPCSSIINEMYTVEDFTGNKGAFIQSSALRRIILGNNDYSLCAGTSNSTSGKLTLKSLSVLGRNNSKVFPDYKFEYASNPNYDPNKWDGWGMYAESGTSAGNTHQTSSADFYPAPWALSKIKSPEGSEIIINYERDTYSSISGQLILESQSYYYSRNNYSIGLQIQDKGIKELPGNTNWNFAAGDKISISGGFITYTCTGSSNGNKNYSGVYTIASVSSDKTKIFLTEPYVFLNDCSSSYANVISHGGIIKKYSKKKYGGNSRVSSIELVDPNGQSYKTRYLYNTENGWSSGVVAQEPEYIKGNLEFPFYKYLDYPFTDVLYGRVTVLTGKLSSDTDYNSKQVFEFETPHSDQYIINTTKIMDKSLISQIECGQVTTDPTCRDLMSLIKHEIVKKTDRIGKLRSVKTYDKSGSQLLKTEYTYTDSLLNNNVMNHQGVFSEGTLMFEIVDRAPTAMYHKAQRTTVLNYPYIIKKTTTTKEDLVSFAENKNWDLFTGVVTEQHSTSPMGVKVKSVIEPAYTIPVPYAELGSKAVNPNNKNMMSQVAANYIYRLNNAGAETGLIEASAMVWKKDWSNYRVMDGSNNYINDDDLSASEEAKAVWRQSGSYGWQGDFTRLNADGTHIFSSSDKFNFASLASNTKWQKTSTVERFNHNSFLLESKDMNGTYGSSKLGYNDHLVIASATNAKYEEIAFSSAEGFVNAAGYFGGEVAKGAGTIVTTSYHSGKSSISLTSGNAFVFKTTGLSTNKKYKAGVWTTETHGRLYYKLNNGSEVLSAAPSNQKKIGSWYYLEFEIPIGGTFTSLEVGVKSSTGASVLFDDFRFQPSDAVMNCFVYNQDSKALEYALGNNNLYTRYQYNDRGLLIKTYNESFKYGEKLVTEMKDDYRRFHVDQ